MTSSTPESTDEQKKARQAALSQAHRTALNTLAERYVDEFNTEKSKEAAALGHEWRPRLSAEEKAAKEFDDLLAAHPHLAQRVPQGE